MKAYISGREFGLNRRREFLLSGETDETYNDSKRRSTIHLGRRGGIKKCGHSPFVQMNQPILRGHWMKAAKDPDNTRNEQLSVDK